MKSWVLIGVFWLGVSSALDAREIALTFDDAPTPDSAAMTGEQRTQKIIQALQQERVPDALFFVKADGINPQSVVRLQQFAQAGFHLANHSFSHQSADQLGAKAYLQDAHRAHLAIKSFDNWLAFHRFPFLHYGKNLQEIRQMQRGLKKLGYRDGYVTVDNFDWYISALISNAVASHATVDFAKARDFYVHSLYESIEFYDAIAQKALKRSPRHVLLLHENDAAAWFVGDLVRHLRAQGWTIISPVRAYQDPIARQFPQVTFHKQGRVAAIAQSKGMPESALRHRSENQAYLDKAFAEAGIVLQKTP
jgi:peptidoglycan-N-acetylglucosamine deacetylase